jgi:hypothetical protein
LGTDGAFEGLIKDERFFFGDGLMGSDPMQSLNHISKDITDFRRQASGVSQHPEHVIKVLLAGFTPYLTLFKQKCLEVF